MSDSTYKTLMKLTWLDVKNKLEAVTILSAHKEITVDTATEKEDAISKHAQLQRLVERFIQDVEFLTEVD